MESADPTQNLMLRAPLSIPFTPQQQKQLNAHSPATFLLEQQAILKWLMSCSLNFTLYFRRFYDNHTKIELWANTEVEKYQDIIAYRFNRLLGKKFASYQEQLEQKINRTKKKRQIISNITTLGKEDLSKTGLQELFYYEQHCAQREKWERNRFLRQRDQDSPYEFYRKTFYACEGKRYISYDCNRKCLKKIKGTWRPKKLKTLTRCPKGSSICQKWPKNQIQEEF